MQIFKKTKKQYLFFIYSQNKIAIFSGFKDTHQFKKVISIKFSLTGYRVNFLDLLWVKIMPRSIIKKMMLRNTVIYTRRRSITIKNHEMV